MLVEDLHTGGNRVRRAEPAWMVLEVVHWGRHHRVKDLPWLVRGQLFHGFGLLFCRDYLTILSASEDSRSFMGGSDVVHCVRLSLTGTTVA